MPKRPHRLALHLHRSVPDGAYRRGLLFLLGVGLPFLAGVVLNDPAGALLGAMTGLILSFGDDDGQLARRLILLVTIAGGVALGGAVGILLHGFAWPIWIVFAVATFASGWFLGVGKAQTLSARFGAMALVVTSGAPEFHPAELGFAVGAVFCIAALRTVDHLVFGRLVQQKPRPRRVPSGGWLRFAMAYAAAACGSLAIGITVDPSRALWVVVTTLVVMQPDARASYVLIVQRIAGTVLGVVAAFAITRFVHPHGALLALALVVAALIPHHLQNRYWLHTALIALLVLLIYDLGATDPRIVAGLFVERLQDVLLGGGIALIGTLIAFPRNPPEEPADPVSG
ncbi:MAG: FUSC family protein [Proteobacteria bacterium]|nr:FUSC family protein [Pseudomonadota bacterium]